MRRRGATLAELLVAMAVASLLLTLVYLAWLASNRTLTWMGSHADAQSSSVVALSRFELEFRMSAYSTLTIYSAPTVLDISFATEDPNTVNMSQFVPLADPAGFEEFVIYYFNAATRSWNRRVWTDSVPPTPDPATTGRMTAGELQNAILAANATDRALASGIVGAVSNPSSYPLGTAVSAVQVTLTVQKTDASGRIVTQTVSASANPRNQP